MKKEHAIIIGLFILSVILRLPHLDDKVTALDEPYTIGDVKPGFWDTLVEAAKDNRGPLYYFFLWPVSEGGIYAMRFLSVVLGAVSIIVSYFFIREMFGPRVALTASILLAFHPFHIVYSQYVRDNILLFVVLAFSSWQFYRFVKGGSIRGVFIANTLLFFTHNLAPLFIVSQFISLLVLRREPAALRTFIIQAVAVGVIVLPWALFVQQESGFGIGVPPIDYNVLRIPHTIYKLSIGIDASSLLVIHPAVLGATVLFFSFLFVSAVWSMIKKDPFNARFLLLHLFLPIIILFVIAATVIQIYNYRYIAPLLPVYVALIAWKLHLMPPKLRYALLVLIIIWYILGDLYYFGVVTTSKDWIVAFGV